MLAITGSMLAAGCADDASTATTTTTTETSAATASTESSTTSAPTTSTTEAETETETEAEEVAEVEADTCDWGSARLPSDESTTAPSGTGGELSETILGSWQHTHIDDGAGFEPLAPTTDIRFVLSSDRFLYCQDVEGATDKSENSAPLRLDGPELILPSPATGYTVTAWDDDAMVWLNHRDGSLYLLIRR